MIQRVFSAVLIALLMSLSVAAEEEIPLRRASLANFPHQQHQKTLGGCGECHGAAEPGRIEGFGEQWGHNTCMGCHRDAQTGPVECTGCHTNLGF